MQWLPKSERRRYIQLFCADVLLNIIQTKAVYSVFFHFLVTIALTCGPKNCYNLILELCNELFFLNILQYILTMLFNILQYIVMMLKEKC